VSKRTTHLRTCVFASLSLCVCVFRKIDRTSAAQNTREREKRVWFFCFCLCALRPLKSKKKKNYYYSTTTITVLGWVYRRQNSNKNICWTRATRDRDGRVDCTVYIYSVYIPPSSSSPIVFHFSSVLFLSIFFSCRIFRVDCRRLK
jgi:hypothetical protein